jgi:hypothetical protein
MNTKFTAEQIFRLTIEKAIREDKHPMEVLEEVKKLIEQKGRWNGRGLCRLIQGKGWLIDHLDQQHF